MGGTMAFSGKLQHSSTEYYYYYYTTTTTATLVMMMLLTHGQYNSRQGGGETPWSKYYSRRGKSKVP